MSGRDHETTVDTPLSKRAVWETSSGRSANAEFSLPPFAFDYHEPRVEASLHKPTAYRDAFQRNFCHIWKRRSC